MRKRWFLTVLSVSDDPVAPVAGMTISVRIRRDLVIVDPDRFLAAAREAYRDRNPGCSQTDASDAVADVTEAMFALLDRAAAFPSNADAPGMPPIWPDPQRPECGPGAPAPGVRVTDRADGLSPAGWLQHVVLGEAQPLQDYGCFAPADPFALPPDQHLDI